jgi:hypothetical protein
VLPPSQYVSPPVSAIIIRTEAEAEAEAAVGSLPAFPAQKQKSPVFGAVVVLKDEQQVLVLQLLGRRMNLTGSVL